jgi:heme exporter protein C
MKTKILLAVSALLMVATLYMIFIHVPTDAETGIIQRIFYLHVPLAWIAFLAFFVVLIGSILYLWKRDFRWDRLASASAEIGVIFITLMLITGSIWAKPAWGAWWVWDARLTMSLILWFIYVAYFLVRSYVAEEGRKARFSAVVGIIGFLDVPLVFLAVRLWKTQHTGLIVFEGGLSPEMVWTLIIGIAAFTALYTLLLIERMSMKKDEDELKELKASIKE